MKPSISIALAALSFCSLISACGRQPKLLADSNLEPVLLRVNVSYLQDEEVNQAIAKAGDLGLANSSCNDVSYRCLEFRGTDSARSDQFFAWYEETFPFPGSNTNAKICPLGNKTTYFDPSLPPYPLRKQEGRAVLVLEDETRNFGTQTTYRLVLGDDPVGQIPLWLNPQDAAQCVQESTIAEAGR